MHYTYYIYAKQKPLTSATKVLEMNGQTNKRLNVFKINIEPVKVLHYFWFRIFIRLPDLIKTNLRNNHVFY